jgi:hypothetical protein
MESSTIAEQGRYGKCLEYWKKVDLAFRSEYLRSLARQQLWDTHFNGAALFPPTTAFCYIVGPHNEHWGLAGVHAGSWYSPRSLKKTKDVIARPGSTRLDQARRGHGLSGMQVRVPCFARQKPKHSALINGIIARSFLFGINRPIR